MVKPKLSKRLRASIKRKAAKATPKPKPPPPRTDAVRTVRAATAPIKRVMTYPSTPPDQAQFQLALKDPFSANAIGARVCDSYTVATATYHLRASMTATSSAAGNFSAIVLPSPCLTLVQAAGNIAGSVSGLTPFPQNTQTLTQSGASYLVAPASMGNVLVEYRVVAWGLRLVAKDTATGTKGKVYVASVPTTANAPSYTTFGTVTADAGSMGLFAAGQDERFLSYIVNLPGVRCFSMQDLLRGEVVMNGTPAHSDFYDFRGTVDRAQQAWSTGYVVADEVVMNAAAGTLVNSTSAGRKDPASIRGGRAFLIYASGLPASTNEFDMEIVYHLEGVPQVNGVSNLIPSSTRATSGSTAIVEKAIAVASAASNLFKYVRDPLNQAAAMRALQFIGL